jgi:hypothetical protein
MSYVQKPPTHWVWLFEPKLSERIVIWFDPYKFANWYMDVHGKMAKTYYHLQN